MGFSVSVSAEAAGMTGHQNECKLDLAPQSCAKSISKTNKRILKLYILSKSRKKVKESEEGFIRRNVI